MERSWSLFVVLGIVIYTGDSAFNCNRPGSKCVQGTCDISKQECSCFRGYTSYLCDTEVAKLAEKCPADYACENKGRCMIDTGGKIVGCHCAYEYYGPTCASPRYTLDCYYDRMVLLLHPLNFNGHIRFIDKLTSSSCDFKSIAELKAGGQAAFKNINSEGYGQVVMHKQDPCNGDAAYSTTHGFDIYTRKVVVQYYDRVYVSLDEILTFICAVEKNNPVSVMKSVYTAPLEDGFLDKSSVRGEGTHFVFSLHKSDNDSQIGDGDTLGVGALVFLRVRVRDHSPFATLIIESCSADDGEDSNQTTYSFHDQGCPVEPVGQHIMKPNAKEFQLYFKIFRFESTNQLRITCVVRGCTSWDSPSCSISQCSPVDRRKREAIIRQTRKPWDKKSKRWHVRGPRAAPNNSIIFSDKKDEKNLNSSEVIRLTVVITDKKKKGEEKGIVIREAAIPSFQACTLSIEFWTLMIVMTVIVVALSATMVFCALKHRNLKNQKKKKSEKAIKLAISNLKRMQMSSWSYYR